MIGGLHIKALLLSIIVIFASGCASNYKTVNVNFKVQSIVNDGQPFYILITQNVSKQKFATMTLTELFNLFSTNKDMFQRLVVFPDWQQYSTDICVKKSLDNYFQVYVFFDKAQEMENWKMQISPVLENTYRFDITKYNIKLLS